MVNLTPINALGLADPVVESIGNITISENPEWAYASVAFYQNIKGMAATFKKATKTKMPSIASFETTKDVTALWIGPDQYLIEAPMSSHETMADDFSASLAGQASVTEQTGAWARFDLTGSDVISALERLSMANSADMPIGGCQRCSIEHVGCILVRRGENEFSVISTRSSSGSVHHGIILAAKAVNALS